MAGERLASAIKKAKGKESDYSDLVFGTVTSISPLKIRVDNRFEITAQFIILSRMVKNLTITIDGRTAFVFRDLKVGDGVRMLRVQNGQKYYVLERS